MKFHNLVIGAAILSASMMSTNAFSAQQKAEASSSVSMSLRSLQMPDITLLTDPVEASLSDDTGAAVSELDGLLRVQYGLTKDDLVIKDNLLALMHKRVAVLLKKGNVIAAYGLAAEVSRFPSARNDKTSLLSAELLRISISPSGDDQDTAKLLEAAKVSMEKIGLQKRSDWHAYIYWSVMGTIFNDEIATKAGVSGLTRTGANPSLVAAVKREIKTIQKMAATRTSVDEGHSH